MNHWSDSKVVQVQKKEKDRTTSKINCPEAIKDYNEHINCANKCSQLKTLCEVDKKTQILTEYFFISLMQSL